MKARPRAEAGSETRQMMEMKWTSEVSGQLLRSCWIWDIYLSGASGVSARLDAD